MAAPAVLTTIPTQRTDCDCAITALAILLQKPYEEVSKVAQGLFFKPHIKGMWTKEIVRLAKVLGTTLVKKSYIEVGPSTGLGVMQERNGDRHVVVLFQGVVIDPSDGAIYNLEAYCGIRKQKLQVFLQV